MSDAEDSDSIVNEFVTAIVRESDKFAKVHSYPMQYGTGGYRADAELLSSVAFRTGVIASFLSAKLHGQPVGLMVTASHNASSENGLKIVNILSSLDSSKWEAYLDQVVNADSADELTVCLTSILKKAKIIPGSEARVFVGYDSRSTSEILAQAVIDGIVVCKAKYENFGLLTTPQLHYMVKASQTYGTPDAIGEPTERGYFEKLSKAYQSLMTGKKIKGTVLIDAANGVGAAKIKELAKYIDPKLFPIEIVNDNIDNPELLNNSCGADFVRTQQKPPNGISAPKHARCASFDGDADRIVYFAFGSHSFHLLDGDKICALFAQFLIDLIRSTGLDLQVGIVQTAYANGASTAFFQKTLKVPVLCVSPGLKHLYHAAQAYDVGVFFEANGHGTILVSHAALSKIISHEVLSPAQFNALKTLKTVFELINQTDGDAITNLLLVEVILAHKNCTLKEWNQLYSEIPSRLIRCEVEDRSIYTTTDAEQKLVTPEGLQEKIDALVAKYTGGRAFVRSSGTEDAVRVYAEASSRGESEDLALRIVELLH
ncbi:phosphoacetylglucosamine mutase [Schizosaccharomyces pombe]|uniref:Phosphoacetylglucosamine mutase 2 n=1 Tax=Schizosaccharomyces pombe (strain 972 / ATCC 24843) TaxID=284812 RepID=AGM2_SCHPO|nr:putative phosphoacetylglucosamine mutase [Schizosaccharomyces pombe]Q09770.2 RecName: Full=Phosphoacetylglucosamine mutase 2; Short=PAGM; AltName: Full=Acetylglucosamine phosphomutase; AltName: Full=N-acetylglucosamine-phosphate mutase [Schizosaccharomyces pombe 972h-]CAA91066.2 phosphoacetylglucosamine mutase (predicted) [Schizosaccharomyces pombe]|eukprot:NP_001342798.1 putative phosphoacetylglucosamine mutase [Schizosaccharomyces pombe]